MGYSNRKGLTMYHEYIKHLEWIYFIDENGIALNDLGHEYRTEDGNIVVIPEDQQYLFKVLPCFNSI